MPRTFTLALALLLLFPALCLGDVHYTLTPEPQNKSVRVTVSVDQPRDLEEFRIPAWCPGFYFLQEYQRKISDVKATDSAGAPLTVENAGDQRMWTVKNPLKQAFTFSYRVLGDDPGLGFFGTNVLDHTAFVNGPSAFVYGVQRLSEPTTLKVNLPQGWDIETPADPGEMPGTYKAGGYDEMIDHPIQMGKFARRKFIQGGIPFDVVFVSKDGQFKQDLDAETERLKAISLPALKMFGSASFKRYTYFIHLAVGNFAGGLEHRASNVQAIGNGKPLNIDDLAAHEYFHAWNVKQIRPKVLGPFDYTQPVRTANLWFAEGVTDYYAQLTTYRSGLHDTAWLLGQLQGNVRELQRSQERSKTTLADTSRRAWESGGFGVNDLSYYTKGLLVGWILDAQIRDATGGEKSLDDVMRTLYRRYALPKAGYDENELLATINEVSGTDMSNLYNRMVNTTEELPYELLAKLGLSVDPASGKVQFDASASASAVQNRNAWLERPGGIR